MTSIRTSDARHRSSFAYELSISAVPYEAALVSDLIAEMASRLQSAPVWEGHPAAPPQDLGPTLAVDRSRLALVLHHRLWQADDATRADALLLRERAREHPESMCVMTLDDAPVPGWLASARRCDLAMVGVHAAAEFTLDAIASAGGTPASAPPPAAAPDPRSLWPHAPAPYVSQPRALGALRRELDALGTLLAPILAARGAREPERVFELHLLPHRVIACLGDVAVSFSWLPGRTPLVGDGRLMVIEWRGVVSGSPQVAPLTSATPGRERVYRAEAEDATRWQWRVDAEHGRAYSTANLIAEWLASSSIAARA